MNVHFRKTDKSDMPRLSKWIAEDSCPQHQGVEPTWWMTDEEREKKALAPRCFAVENAAGPIFYIKLEHVMRCYIQFAPDMERDKEVTKLALAEAFKQVAAGGRALGYDEMIFESKSESLVNFFTAFHFKEVKDNFLVRL